MKIIISSARTMVEKPTTDITTPIFLSEANILLNELKNKNKDELNDIWKCSNNQFEKFYNQLCKIDLFKDLTPAINSYQGVVFRQFNELLDNNKYREYINNHIYILSSLYGLLRPTDGIREYHLEMASSYKIDKVNLYKFWNTKLHDYLSDDVIINLSSEEYGKCIRNYLGDKDCFIDIDFVEMINGEASKISTQMKKARGLFVKYMTINNIDNINSLRLFDFDGYNFDERQSSNNRLVFVKEKI